jgi:fermentation-respiration switch protein FrsA (DUF1100 family)
MIIRLVKRIAAAVAFLYVAVLLFLMANETKLVYPGSKYPRGNWTPENFDYEEVEFQSADGTKLVGWYLHAPDAAEIATAEIEADAEFLLLCHGNAENVAQSAAYVGDRLRKALRANVFVFDYRGYGKSEGVPFERGVLEDSEAAFEWLKQKSGKAADEIILVGHSIGGGPAVHLASEQGARTLVLQRTFNALTEPAANQYPWLPIRYVMRNQFRSIDKIRNYQGPLFQSHGVQDRLIPIRMGRELFDAAPTTRKKFIAVDGMSHYEPLPESYWSDLKQFVEHTVDH